MPTSTVGFSSSIFTASGNQGEGTRGYAAAQVVATQSAPDLGLTLSTILKETGAENVWLMGSSLGCQTICDAFAWLASQPDAAATASKLSHVVLSAPDVSGQCRLGRPHAAVAETARQQGALRAG